MLKLYHRPLALELGLHVQSLHSVHTKVFYLFFITEIGIVSHTTVQYCNQFDRFT